MAYTLISFVGKGQFEKEKEAQKHGSGYLPANYKFQNIESPVKTHIFLEALLKSKLYDVKKIILIGTLTSSWDLLIYDLATENEESLAIWEKMQQQCTTEGISNDNIEFLQTKLNQKYGIPVVIKAHEQKIDADNISEIFSVYNSIIGDIEPKTKILFDITHGFRSMPLLAYQALMFGNLQRKETEIIYGELRRANEKKGEDPENPPESPVRDLKEYWLLGRQSKALNAFKETLDGKELSGLLMPYWKEGAEVVKGISTIANFNLPLCITEFTKNLRKVIKSYNAEKKNELTDAVKKELENIERSMSVSTNISENLLAFSQLLENKKCYFQAVNTLWISVETRVIEKLDKNKIGNYNFWQKYGESEFETIIQTIFFGNNILQMLRNFRNNVSHGGAQFRKKEELPDEKYLRKLYLDSVSKVKEFFQKVKV